MKSSNGYEGTMPVVLFQEDGIWYAHCAALEITGYGHTSEEAKQSFRDNGKRIFPICIGRGHA